MKITINVIYVTQKSELFIQGVSFFNKNSTPIHDLVTLRDQAQVSSGCGDSKESVCEEMMELGNPAACASDPRRAIIMEAGTMDSDHPDSVPS
jgi:hypothetical protein